MTNASKARRARRREYYRARRRRQRMIAWGIAAVFVVLNVILAAYFWPKIAEYRKDVREGRIQPVIRLN